MTAAKVSDRGATSARRDEILAIAAELIARKGIRATTIREISDAAGILPGSLYHHFESKDEIIAIVMDGYLTDLVDRYRQVLERCDNVRDAFAGMIDASLASVRVHQEATLIYQNEVPYFRESRRFAHVRRGGQQVRAMWVEVIDRAVAEGVFRSDIPAAQLYAVLRDGLWLSVRWFQPVRGHGYDELACEYTRLFYQAFASPRTLRELMEHPG